MNKIFLFSIGVLLSLVSTAQVDPVFTAPGYYGQTFFSYSMSDNILFAAPERFRVTSTVQNSNTGLLFDQDYNSPAVTVSAGQSTTISIDFKGKGGTSLSNAAGYVYLNFFDENHPDSIYIRAYDSTGDFADFQWDEWSNASTTSPYLLFRLHIPSWVEHASRIELKIFAHSGTPLILTEIEYYLELPGQFEKGLVSKFNNNTLWRDLAFRDTGNVQRAYIKRNGTAYVTRLGIGTENMNDDSSKLFVEGRIRGREIKVDVDAWPDYVFAKKYQLPSLKQIKKFIQQNNHLPEIPSAVQIDLGGLNIGQIQALQMKKIEELTLYLIKKDEEMAQMRKEIKELKKHLPQSKKR